jgi:hypothetical protein
MLYGRPKPGKEENFAELTARINELDGRYPLSDQERARLEKMVNQREKIAILPWEEIGCPRIGRDEAADRWLEEKFEERHADPEDEWHERTLEEVRKDLEGVYVEELAAEPEGIALIVGPLTGLLDFRGKVVGYCEKIIGDELAEEAYVAHTAEECLIYAACIDQKLGEFLEEHDELDDEEIEHIEDLLEAVRWLRFWGGRGFGYEPWE